MKCLAVAVLALVAMVHATQGATNTTGPLPVQTGNILLLKFAGPKPGMEQAFDKWYENHLVELTHVPGVLSARLNKLVATGAMGKLPPSSLSMYELKGTQLDAIDKEIKQRTQDGRIKKNEAAVDYDSIVTIQAKPLGPAMFARDVPGTSSEALGSAGPVKEYQFIVFSDPTKPEVENEYNDWYDHQHMPDVLRVPGFQFAQRFVITSASANNKTARYFIIFNLQSRDLAATNAEIGRRLREGITKPTTTMGNGSASFMETVGAPVFAN